VSLSSPFIRRPIGTLLLTIGLFLTGVAAFFVLPVAPLPQVDFPTIRVRANLSGASPETMASSVASPLERRLQTIAGITELTSQSSNGSTDITLQFDLSKNIDSAAREVQAAINAARADLPATLRQNPSYNKVNPSDSPVMILALTSPNRSPAEIYDTVSNLIQQRLAQVPGVGEVELGGGSLPAVRVEVNPLALSGFGISLEDVRTALADVAANRPRGFVEGEGLAWEVRGATPGLRAADYAPVVIAWRNGAAVRLADVAKVTDGPEDVRTTGLFNGERAVTVVIRRQPGANIIATVDAVRAQVPVLQRLLPADIRLQVASDRTTTIRASLHEVELTLVIATLLVVAVVSVFLRSLRATIVPFVAVVVSVSGTLGAMYLLGFSLNNLSLMALTIATGFVVDDAIVVLENIMRHHEQGMPRREAALIGARQVGFTVLSISISLVAVFIPLLFMGGIVGRLFREFAVTMSVAVMISLVISLTTTPMLAAQVLPEHSRPNRFTRWFENRFGQIERTYARSLDWALANRAATLTILGGAVALNIFLFTVVPKGFFPEQDTGSMTAFLSADRSISFEQMSARLAQVVTIIRRDPGVATVTAFSGSRGGGFMFVTLKPKREREPARAIIARLRPKLGRVTGLAVYLNPVQDVRIGGRGGSGNFQYTLKSEDPALLEPVGRRMEAAMAKEKILTDVDLDLEEGGAQVFLDIDRDTARRLGVTSRDIDSALYNAFGQRQVADIYSGLNQYHVVLGVEPRFASGPGSLANVYVPVRAQDARGEAAGTASATGAIVPSGSAAGPTSATGTGDARGEGSAVSTAAETMVPLSTLARWRVIAVPAEVDHQDGAPAVTISFGTADGSSLGQASDRIREIESAIGLPTAVRGSFAGTAKVFAESTATMPILILSALVVIYIVLGILYESAIHPLTVLSTLPSAGLGAVLALAVLGQELDLIALIGLILLIGIVKKNAIMIIDFALDAERSRGLTPAAAIREASILRFRPILMTTLAAGLGAFPLAIGFGEGAELRRPLGFTIIGGLIASQFITLLTTPVVYLALDRFRSARSRSGPMFKPQPAGALA
jgi:multidrug efflux pump